MSREDYLQEDGMPRMTKDQMDEFLKGSSHLMKLATLRPNGAPYVNPVWYDYNGEAFHVAGRRKATWVANITEDSRVSFCIDTSEPPYKRVIVEGSAVIEDGAWLGDWEHWAVRYLGREAGHRYYEDTKATPRALIRITPETITTWAGPGWHPRYEE